ncbi:MAG TPA: DegT/DnrJ/EryC1/StrS family aminotransferase [Gemmatimonadales bacterium]|nr:DegT/DnrJ/EryC1/StrS family aminotransferase [Gemmatimonadales bacterium]
MIASLRHQPPVHSPLTPGALAAGVRTMLGGPAAAGTAAARLERWLATEFGAREVLLTDSGTSALTLALRAAARLGATPVALPAYCCYDIATAAAGADVPVLLYDVDPATLGPDEASLCRALEQGARTVVVAHLYGVPVDIERVRRLAAGAGALLVEDAAQGTGIRFGDRPAGALGSLGVLSFGRGKGMTGGGGGALLANDERGLRALATVRAERTPAAGRGLRPLAASVAQWILARPALYGLPAALPFLGLGETHYREPAAPGAPPAFILGTLERTRALAAEEAAVRRRHAARLLDVLAALPAGSLRPVAGAPGAVPGWLRLPVVVLGDASQDEGRLAAGRRLGIMPGYPRALADLPALRVRLANPGEGLAGARCLTDRLLTLPTHGRLRAGDLDRLETWLREAVSP